MSDSEPDFDDPRFLVDAAPSTSAAELSYHDRRRRKLIESELKGKTKPRHQLEEEQRQRGLSHNLVDTAHRQLEGENKAFKMMQAMGFKPGDSLGKPQEQEPTRTTPRGFAKASFAPSASTTTDASSAPASSTSTSTPAVPTTLPTGSSTAEDTDAQSFTCSSTANPSKRTNEPIKFQIRTGRTGLGIPQKPSFLPHTVSPSTSTEPYSTTTTTSPPLPDLTQFLDHLRSTVDSKRAFGILKSCRRTLEELDRRTGAFGGNGDDDDENVMWFDPDELERQEREFKNKRLFEEIDRQVDSDEEQEEGGGEEEGSSRGKVVDRPSEKRREKSELDYLRGRSDTVIDDPEDERVELERERSERDLRRRDQATRERKLKQEEKEEWFSLDVKTRLGLTLTHLRQHYHYCYYCGCQYNDSKDLEENCPGTEEEDH